MKIGTFKASDDFAFGHTKGIIGTCTMYCRCYGKCFEFGIARLTNDVGVRQCVSFTVCHPGSRAPVSIALIQSNMPVVFVAVLHSAWPYSLCFCIASRCSDTRAVKHTFSPDTDFFNAQRFTYKSR